MTQSKQPDTWTRFAINRESVGEKFGRFGSVLATNGEASDGHILSIPGMRMPDSMPLMFRHQSTVEIPILGRITNPSKSVEDNKEVLRVVNNIDVEGESGDPLLAIRRGFATLVQNLTLDAMSVRWDPVFGKFVPRSSLSKDHFAFADRDGPNAFGMFFEESIAREGSLVAIGADPAALVGRAKEAESIFEEAYWLVLAGRVGSGEVMPDIPPEMRLMFDTMTKVMVKEVRDAVSRETFSMREHEDELGESLLDEAQAKAQAEKASREVPVEIVKTTKAESRVLSGAQLRSVIHETAAESAGRKIDQALGRITR